MAVMPRAASFSATSRATVGPVVERSTNTFAAPPATMPSGPSATSRTMAGVGRLTSTISASAATSAGE